MCTRAVHCFCSHVALDMTELRKHALNVAARIASLSPVAVQGTKINLNQARGRSVSEGLQYAVCVALVSASPRGASCIDGVSDSGKYFAGSMEYGDVADTGHSHCSRSIHDEADGYLSQTVVTHSNTELWRWASQGCVLHVFERHTRCHILFEVQTVIPCSS